MGKLLKRKNNTLSSRHELSHHSYTSPFPLHQSKILISYPNLTDQKDFTTVLKHIVDNLSDEVDQEDHEILLNLYKNALEENTWNYVPSAKPVWLNDDAAFFSLNSLNSSERFLLYGLKEELWRIQYEDTIFGWRQFVGQITEINRDEKFLILDSNGNKRRLNLSKILGASDYGKKWSAIQGTMSYALFTFQDAEENKRKVSWEVLPDDRSETLYNALGLTKEEAKEIEKELPEKPKGASSKTTPRSPLPRWEDKLGEKVSVRLLKEDGFKDYYLVVDHLAWDPITNIAEIGSRGLTISSTQDNLIVKLL